MKHILVLGAGKSTSYLISYLLRNAIEHDWFITVGDRRLDLARKSIEGHQRGQAIQLDINDASTRATLIAKSAVVINMLTRPYQHLVALECLNQGVHMVTASYEDPKVRALDSEAHRKNVLILNEMGFDPGIDHMLGMSVINRLRKRGGVVSSFRSYGGGLPAPNSTLNPFRYGITWNPRNVLMAGEDGAVYKEDGHIRLLPFHHLFERTWTVDVDGVGTLEAYPNRDSLAYEAVLGLKANHTIVRGTLRYPGWSETWQQIVYLGLANEVLAIPNLQEMTYQQLTAMCLPQDPRPGRIDQQVANYLGISPTGKIMENLKWLGLFSDKQIGFEASTAADAMIHLIQDKLRMPEDALDIAILVMEIECVYPNEQGRKEQARLTLVVQGRPGDHTAIAKTVGLPVAIGVKLLLTNRLPLTGCHIPIHPAVYEPVVEGMKEEGLEWTEEVRPAG